LRQRESTHEAEVVTSLVTSDGGDVRLSVAVLVPPLVPSVDFLPRGVSHRFAASQAVVESYGALFTRADGGATEARLVRRPVVVHWALDVVTPNDS